MNLAKIRKKSRNLQGTTTFVLPECRQTTRNMAIDCSSEIPDQPGFFEQVIEPCHNDDRQIAVLSYPVKTTFVARDLDPLELIMTGRRVAGCDEDIRETDDESTEKVVADYKEYLSVRVADELYGIHIMGIKEIIRPREITELPQAPLFLTGVISLRGVIVPVIDMLSRLGLKGQPDVSSQRIVVIKAGEGFVGLLVEEVIQVVRIASVGIEPASTVLEGIDRDFVSGIGRSDNRIIILLNLENIADINLC